MKLHEQWLYVKQAALKRWYFFCPFKYPQFPRNSCRSQPLFHFWSQSLELYDHVGPESRPWPTRAFTYYVVLVLVLGARAVIYPVRSGHLINLFFAASQANQFGRKFWGGGGSEKHSERWEASKIRLPTSTLKTSLSSKATFFCGSLTTCPREPQENNRCKFSSLIKMSCLQDRPPSGPSSAPRQI